MDFNWNMMGKDSELVVAKHLPERGFFCGIMAFGFTTIPESESPNYHAGETAAKTTVEEIQRTVEDLLSNEAVPSALEAYPALLDSLSRVDQKLISFGNVIAQGVYAGGCIFYMVDITFVCIPFGGSHVYCWGADPAVPQAEANRLRLIGGGIGKDGLIRDALGAHGNKSIRPFYGILNNGMALYMTGSPIDPLDECSAFISGTNPCSRTAEVGRFLMARLSNPTRCSIVMQIQQALEDVDEKEEQAIIADP